ncbi:MAG: DNA replication/repair protein RecF [Halothiobacillaceae bacterium]
MIIEQLQVAGLRNLAAQKLPFHPGLNGIHGANGAGKTSLLEALHLLAAGRSFRTTANQHYIAHDARCATVSARLCDETGLPVRLGMERCRDQLQLRVDGNPCARLSDFVRHLPAVALHPDSDSLITGSPDHRRRFLDRGVFHADAEFGDWSLRYVRALRQRNASLRTGTDERHWESSLVTAGEQIDRKRLRFAEELAARLRRIGQTLPGQPELDLRYQPGFRRDLSLAEALEQARPRDRELASTQVGPHRANLLLRMNGHPAQATASRGQLKILVSMLTLSLLQLWRETYGRSAVVLFDDLPSELDAHHFGYLVEWLGKSGHQAFVTAVDPESIAAHVDAMYRAEAGRITMQDTTVRAS